jgi:hypothetical protein
MLPSRERWTEDYIENILLNPIYFSNSASSVRQEIEANNTILNLSIMDTHFDSVKVHMVFFLLKLMMF